MADSDQLWETVRFLSVVSSLGFVTGEMIGPSLSFKWVVISIIAMWACVYVLAYMISGSAMAGITTLAMVWTVIGMGAILGSIASASRYGIFIVPLTLLAALYAANRWPLFALLLAIMAAGALFTRYAAASAVSESEPGFCTSNEEMSIESKNHDMRTNNTLISGIFEFQKSDWDTALWLSTSFMIAVIGSYLRRDGWPTRW